MRWHEPRKRRNTALPMRCHSIIHVVLHARIRRNLAPVIPFQGMVGASAVCRVDMMPAYGTAVYASTTTPLPAPSRPNRTHHAISSCPHNASLKPVLKNALLTLPPLHAATTSPSPAPTPTPLLLALHPFIFRLNPNSTRGRRAYSSLVTLP